MHNSGRPTDKEVKEVLRESVTAVNYFKKFSFRLQFAA